MTNDDNRIIISRWRLSSHKLFVETGRYKIPKIDPDKRYCLICNVVEDEYHALFVCKAHHRLRLQFSLLIDRFDSVNDLLNPKNIDDLKTTADYINEIEKNIDRLKMIQ